MISTGFTLLLLGVVGGVYSYTHRETMADALGSLFPNVFLDPGMACVYACAAVAVIGLICLLLGAARRK